MTATCDYPCGVHTCAEDNPEGHMHTGPAVMHFCECGTRWFTVWFNPDTAHSIHETGNHQEETP